MANETIIGNMIVEAQGRKEDKLVQATARFKQELGVIIGANLVAALDLTPTLNPESEGVAAATFVYLGTVFTINRGLSALGEETAQFYARVHGMPQGIWIRDADTLLLWIAGQVAA